MVASSWATDRPVAVRLPEADYDAFLRGEQTPPATLVDYVLTVMYEKYTQRQSLRQPEYRLGLVRSHLLTDWILSKGASLNSAVPGFLACDAIAVLAPFGSPKPTLGLIVLANVRSLSSTDLTPPRPFGWILTPPKAPKNAASQVSAAFCEMLSALGSRLQAQGKGVFRTDMLSWICWAQQSVSASIVPTAPS